MDNSKSDIALVSNNRLLETGTSNLLFVKDQKFFTPKKGYYEGNTYKFFKTKIKNRRFGIHFSIILASFFDTFSASIFGCVFGRHFIQLSPEMAPKMGP